MITMPKIKVVLLLLLLLLLLIKVVILLLLLIKAVILLFQNCCLEVLLKAPLQLSEWASQYSLMLWYSKISNI